MAPYNKCIHFYWHYINFSLTLNNLQLPQLIYQYNLCSYVINKTSRRSRVVKLSFLKLRHHMDAAI